MLDGLLHAALVALLVLAYGSVGNRWYRAVVVTSGSMSPVFEAGDMIIVTPPPEELRPGTIVSLRAGEEIVTHRIVRVEPDGRLYTKGDANNVLDQWVVDPADPRCPIRVIGVYRGRIPYVGFAVDWLARQAQGLRALATRAEFRDSATLRLPFAAGVWEE